MLVTERPGRLRIVADGKLSPPLAGVPKVFASSQGGLHDVALDRNFAQNQTIYFCFADPHDGGGRTSMARARLAGDALDDVKVIFRQEGPPSSGRHFGCRIVQTPDDNLFLTMGDHGSYPQGGAEPRQSHRQDRSRYAGRRGAERQSVRRPQGRQAGNLDLRQPQCAGRGAASVTGKLWTHEHGPQGGDEVNIIEKGKNYGWPVIGYGVTTAARKSMKRHRRPEWSNR